MIAVGVPITVTDIFIGSIGFIKFINIMNNRTYKFAPPSEEKPDPELVIKYIFKGINF